MKIMNLHTSIPWNVLRDLTLNSRAAVNAAKNLVELLVGAERCSSDPAMLQLEVTIRCNLRCEYCIVHNGSETGSVGAARDMSFDLFRSILAQFPRTFYLQLFGQGEPLLLGDRLVEMVEEGARQGRFVSLVTNGSLCDAARSRDLLEAGLDAIAFSLDLCPAEHMIDNRRGMDLGLIEANLRQLIELRNHLGVRASIGVSSVIFRSTSQQELEQAIRYIDDIGIDFLIVGPLASTASYKDRYSIALRNELIDDPAWWQRIPNSTRCRIYTTPGSNFLGRRCIWAWGAVYVNYDGSISYCANNHRLRLQAERTDDPQGWAHVLDPAIRNLPLYRSLRRDFATSVPPSGCVGCQYLLGPRALTEPGARKSVASGVKTSELATAVFSLSQNSDLE